MRCERGRSRVHARPSLGLLLAALCIAAGSCGGRPDGRGSTAGPTADAATEYRFLEAEKLLAGRGAPYLVIEVPARELRLKLKGAVVWACPIEAAPGSDFDLEAFARHFARDGRVLRPVAGRHLFASKDRNPAKELEIVSKVVKADASLMQRQIPERFTLYWEGGLVMDLRTGAQGATPASRLRNRAVSARDALRSLFGGDRLQAAVDPEKAVTLYRVAAPGLPTLVAPYGPPPPAPVSRM